MAPPCAWARTYVRLWQKLYLAFEAVRLHTKVTVQSSFHHDDCN